MAEIIAEIGQAFDGSIGILHSMIDGAAGAGAGIVKFQMHIAEAESSDLEPFRKKFSRVDKTRRDYWTRMELSDGQWRDVRDHCHDLNVEFLVTPFSKMAVEKLETLGVGRYKIGSGDIGNEVLLESIRRTEKDVIVSTGLASEMEIDRVVSLLGKDRVTILHCSTSYPSTAEQLRLGEMGMIRERFGVPVGLSDHSGTIFPCLAAVALGASIVEAHVTFDKRMFGPDSMASLTFDEFKQMAEGVRFLEIALGSSPEDRTDKEELRRIFGRSLAVNRDIQEGEIIQFSDIEGKKPMGAGLPAVNLETIIGKTLRRSLSKWEFLKEGDLV